MAGIQYALPPDLATLEDYCNKWARWAEELEKIKAQCTDQAKLSAIQDDIDAIKAEIRQLQQRLQQRIQDRDAAIKEGWESHWARLVRHLRELPPTDIPHHLWRGTGFGGEDGSGRHSPRVATAQEAPSGHKFRERRTEAAGSNPKPAPYSFFEESSRASEADCATTICSSPSGSIFNHGAPHSSPVTPNRIKQENQQSPGGLAVYRSVLRANGQTKPADRQISPAERSSPTIPFSAGIPRTPASERNPDDRDVW
ncbi:hypothetical protein GGR55DRAFT_684663 [Xylaria sp. FL0064]|nr:hypothetical protein GGR55DRAFT_684663 [Xylaria sp. FL0064]